MVRFLLKTDKFIVITIIYNDSLLLLKLVATASHAGNTGSNPVGTTIRNRESLLRLFFSLGDLGRPAFQAG